MTLPSIPTPKAVFGAVLLLCTACTPPVQITPTPTDLPLTSVTCADLDTHWGDWPATIMVLERLIEMGEACGPEPLISKLYAAHYSYGVELEETGDTGSAVAHYTAALDLIPDRDEALQALARLEALPEPTQSICASTSGASPDPASPGAPDRNELVTSRDDQLYVGSEPFAIAGVNYYPRHAPWRRFLTEANPDEMAQELTLLEEAGFNTIRIFLWYEPLFTCPPEDAVPNEEAFARLDGLLATAAQHNLKVLITLNDLPDLYFRPLYTDWARYDAQTRYIVRRYRHNTTLLGWDLRNEGDLDYGGRGVEARFHQTEVTAWLEHVAALLRENDPYHLITAGWWGDPAVTAPLVDVISFHHWGDAHSLATRIESYQTLGKPLLLEEVGYSTWLDGSPGASSWDQQAQLLQEAVLTVESREMAGWLIWTAFDFPPEPGQPEGPEHYFGLWTLDLEAKPALSALTGSTP